LRELTGPWADVQPENITWTPDSQQILFVRQEGKLTQVTRSELWGIPVEGGEPARLGFSRTGGLGRFSIHPDGKRMVFSLAEPRAREIWVMENLLPGAPSAGR
jgi:dipeptidyl aminopeptidase/acylaminoacyl peptidase